MSLLLLDLFCGAGGAAMGYHRAGFTVVGVDIQLQPRYPFMFVQSDALDFARRNGHLFAAIHASPPCQAHTTMSNRWRGKGTRADTHRDLIGDTRAVLMCADRPYVIENVPGARKMLLAPITLTGGMFGLRVHRPRLFESSVALVAPPTAKPPVDAIGVYGREPDGRRLFTRKDGTIQRAARGLDEARLAMGVPWMEWRELAESIPPAYTNYIGSQLIKSLTITTDSEAVAA